MTYACLKKQLFTQDTYTLVPLRHEDIYKIKQWRNAQIRILRQAEPLTDDMQEKYFRNVIYPSFSTPEPAQILFSFLENGTCIGYGGIVHIDWRSKRGEVSFLLNTEKTLDQSQYRHYFSIYLQLIKQVAFEDLKFHRLFTETFDIRPLHMAILEEQGFIPEGRMKDHIWLDDRYVDALLHGFVRNIS